MATAIDALIERQDSVLTYLRDNGQLSLAVDFEDSYRKLLVMACGSFFETHLVGHLAGFAFSCSDARVGELVKNKALNRQYHTLFKWDAANVNAFLGLFGEVYKQDVGSRIADSDSLCSGLRAFLQIGAERNRLAHGNLGDISPDLTIDEIKQRYVDAWGFLQFLCSTLVAER